MLLAVFFVLLVSCLSRSADLEFNIQDYFGDISQSILRLYYGKTGIWERQPSACYGVLVDWKIALFPCSCLSYTKDDKQTNKAWRHTTPVKNQMVDVSSLEVGTMFEEYESKYGNHKVKVVKYLTGSGKLQCASDLLYEWAAVELQRRINFSTLIWFPTANMTLMRNLTEESVKQSETGSDSCRVVYWDKDEITDEKTGKTKEKHFRSTKTVYLWSWHNCNDTVCPSYEELTNYKVNLTNNTWTEDIPESASGMKQDRKICLNEQPAEKKRSCVGWSNGPMSICNAVPGTPVICDSTRVNGGIIGTITNATLFCPNENIDVHTSPLNLVAEAIPLIQKYLRIQNAPGYDGFFKPPPKGPSQLYFLQPHSLATEPQPFSLLWIFIFNVIISKYFYHS